MLGVEPDVGLTGGTILAALLLGLRHGFDVDHLVAISDITGSQIEGRDGFRLATFYAMGHALVVLALGAIAIAAGGLVPDGMNAVAGRFVGMTLIALGVYLLYSLVKHGADVRPRGRTMLLVAGLTRVTGALRRRGRAVVVEHSHEHDHVGTHGHDHLQAAGGSDVKRSSVAAKAKHVHVHRHVAAMPADPFQSYGAMGALGVGMVHGIGAETPTQVLVVVTAAGVGGIAAGGLLASFVLGLLLSNSLIALAGALGFANARRSRSFYVVLAAVTGVISVAIGMSYLVGAG